MHAFVVRRKLAPAFLSLQEASKSNISHDATTPKATSLTPCESCQRHIYEPVYHFSSTGKNNYQNSQFAMETICVGQREETNGSTKLPGEKIQGISFKSELWLQRGEAVLDTHPKTNGEDKSSEPRAGWRVGCGGVRMSLAY